MLTLAVDRVRHLMSAVTAKALYGEEDPFEKDPELEGALW